MNKNILAYGSTSPLPESVELRAGSLAMVYEAGFIRYISVNGVEVLRLINHAVRDRNWGTVPIKILHENIHSSTDQFSISYEALCSEDDINFLWKCSIVGLPDSSLTFTINGEALSTFERNRIGFTVLHPIEGCAGKPCTIRHPDLSSSLKRFPLFIASHQPFKNLAGMTWEPAPGIEASLQFTGEIFETEDQRNWTDASYKTYCTPLDKPFPIRIEKGDTVFQRTILKSAGDPEVSVAKKKSLSFSLDTKKKLPFPLIGLPLSNLTHSEQQLTLLKDLNLDFVRIEVKEPANLGPSQVEKVCEILRRLKVYLEVVLFVDETNGHQYIPLLSAFKGFIRQIIILPLNGKTTDEKLIDQYVPLLRKHFPQCKIGGGTDAFFAELNRFRTPNDKIDFLSFSINPTVHAFDLLTVTENLVAQKDAAISCREIANGKKVHAGPVTFRMRWNPHATSASKGNADGTVPSYIDPRQLSLYGAAWTLGSLKYLSESEVSAIGYYQTCGWGGVIPHAAQPWPAEYNATGVVAYPLYFIFKEVLQRKNLSIVPLLSVEPNLFDGVAFEDDTGKRSAIIANYSPAVLQIGLPEIGAFSTCTLLDQTVINQLTVRPQNLGTIEKSRVEAELTLPAFSIAILQ